MSIVPKRDAVRTSQQAHSLVQSGRDSKQKIGTERSEEPRTSAYVVAMCDEGDQLGHRLIQQGEIVLALALRHFTIFTISKSAVRTPMVLPSFTTGTE